MFLTKCLLFLRKSSCRSARPSARRGSTCFLQVEPLEERKLPSCNWTSAMPSVVNSSNQVMLDQAALGSVLASIPSSNPGRVSSGLPPSPGLPSGMELPDGLVAHRTVPCWVGSGRHDRTVAAVVRVRTIEPRFRCHGRILDPTSWRKCSGVESGSARRRRTTPPVSRSTA